MKPPEQRPFLVWPGWGHLRMAGLLTLLVSALFAVVFISTNWITAQHLGRVRVHSDAELQIPLVPSFTVIYMGIYALFIAAPFVLCTRQELTTLAVAQTMTILIAGIWFLLIPAKLAFVPATDSELGIWRDIYRYADRLNFDYNLVPSLHVALSITCVELFASRANLAGKRLLRTFGLLVAAATVFTH
jgi:hypothetical protein